MKNYKIKLKSGRTNFVQILNIRSTLNKPKIPLFLFLNIKKPISNIEEYYCRAMTLNLSE